MFGPLIEPSPDWWLTVDPAASKLLTLVIRSTMMLTVLTLAPIFPEPRPMLNAGG
jgi:hypothetical protein